MSAKGRVTLRCYAELNDYLARVRRQRDFEVRITGAETLRDLVAGLGIPAGEVEVALVNGVSGGLDRSVRDGDRISLYPMFEAFDVSPLLRLRQRPLRRARFLADAHLGRLARYLRLVGFDTLFENDPGDAALVRISREQHRILLSRDRELLRRRELTHGLWIPSIRPREQIAYLVHRLDLYDQFRPFTRCMICNGTLQREGKGTLEADLPPRVRTAFDTFWRCKGCNRVYWQGSHYDRLRLFIGRLIEGRRERSGLVRE